MGGLFKPVQRFISNASFGVIPAPKGEEPFFNVLRPKDSGLLHNPLQATFSNFVPGIPGVKSRIESGVGGTAPQQNLLQNVMNQLPSPGDKVTEDTLKSAEDVIRRARAGPGITTGPLGVLGVAPSFKKTLIGLTKDEIMGKLGLLGGQSTGAKLGG